MRVLVRFLRSLLLCTFLAFSFFATSFAQACASAPVELQHLCKVLNDNNWYLSSDYAQAIEEWPESLLIWQFLESDFARYRFARFVMNLEEPKQYIKGRNLRKTLDLTFCYECRHFSRERYYKYSLAQQVLNVDAEYSIEKAFRKHQIPIHEVEQSSPGMIHGHAINAVYLGDQAADPRDVMNWVFFEPQRNWVLHSAERPLSLSAKPIFKAGTVLYVYPEVHSATLDRMNSQPRFPQGIAIEALKGFIFAVDRTGVLRNLKIPNLDAYASAAPMGVAVEIVSHRYSELRHVFIRQATDQARASLLESIKNWGDWPEKQMEFLIRLRAFLFRLEVKYATLNQASLAEGVSDVLAYLDDPFLLRENPTMPWFNELIDFLDSEKKFLRIKIPQEYILQADAEKVLFGLEKCAAKLKSPN